MNKIANIFKIYINQNVYFTWDGFHVALFQKTQLFYKGNIFDDLSMQESQQSIDKAIFEAAIKQLDLAAEKNLFMRVLMAGFGFVF